MRVMYIVQMTYKVECGSNSLRTNHPQELSGKGAKHHKIIVKYFMNPKFSQSQRFSKPLLPLQLPCHLLSVQLLQEAVCLPGCGTLSSKMNLVVTVYPANLLRCSQWPASSHCNCELLGSLCVDACVSEGTASNFNPHQIQQPAKCLTEKGAAPRPWTSLMCRGLES